MNKKNRNTLVHAFIFGCVALALSGCDQDAGSATRREPQTYELPVVEVDQQDLALYYRTTGSVISDNRVDITSRVTGFIQDIGVTDGQRVAKGQLLVSLDSSHVDGLIRQAESSVSKARLSLQDAETDVERYENLFNSGTVAENSLRKIRLQRDVARDSLREAAAGLATAKSELQYTRIVSPADGVVVVRSKRAGDLAAPGVPIIAIESDSALLFDTYVPESHVSRVKVGHPVSLEIDALGKTLSGEVTSVIPSGDPVTRRYQVKVALPGTTDALPGMFGRARFEVGLEQSPMIPATALIERGGLQGVFVVDDDNCTHFRWLRLGRALPESVQVTAGLDAGERIVAIANIRLREGDCVSAAGSVE